MNQVKVMGLSIDPILQLIVSRPMISNALSVLNAEGKYVEVHSHHITLARLDDLGLSISDVKDLPAPPIELSLRDQVLSVSSGVKSSLYVPLAPWSQEDLREYVKEISGILQLNLYDPDREFHVSLANAGGGNVRASVGDVWKYPSHRIY